MTVTPTDNDSGKGTYRKPSPSTGTPAAMFCAQSARPWGRGVDTGAPCRLRACVRACHGSSRTSRENTRPARKGFRTLESHSVPLSLGCPGGRDGADPSRRRGTALPSGATRRWGSGSPPDAAGDGYVGGRDAHELNSVNLARDPCIASRLPGAWRAAGDTRPFRPAALPPRGPWGRSGSRSQGQGSSGQGHLTNTVIFITSCFSLRSGGCKASVRDPRPPPP